MRRTVNIERLNLRFRNVPEHVVRPALPHLGRRMLRRLAGQETLNRVHGSHSIGQLDLGSLRLLRGVTSMEIENAIARALSRAIVAQVEEEPSD